MKTFLLSFGTVITITEKPLTAAAQYPCENPCCAEIIFKHDGILNLQYWNSEELLFQMHVCKYCTEKFLANEKGGAE